MSIKLELGKTYKDRRGIRVGPLLPNTEGRWDVYPFRVAGDSHVSFCADGSFVSARDPSSKDLVAEWEEPTALPQEAYAAPSAPPAASATSGLRFLAAVAVEVDAARTKFPSNADLTHAMTEEFGEAVKALMDMKQKPGRVNSEGVYKECVQAAAMAMRLATEGDPCFPAYVPR